MTTVELHVVDLWKKAAELRLAARRIQTRVVKAADEAVQESFLPALVATVPQFIPSGFAPTLAPALRVDTSARYVGSPGVSVTISAPTAGRKGRDVAAFEKGRLKHPLFGNKSHWYTTRIKPGFAKTALKSTRPAIVKAIDAELEEIARELAH